MTEEQLQALVRVLYIAQDVRRTCIDLQLRDAIRSDIRILSAYGAALTAKEDVNTFFETQEILTKL